MTPPRGSCEHDNNGQEMTWRDHLPVDCTPEDAFPPDGVIYRLTKRQTPKPEDFLSYRELYPDRVFDQPECILGGVSVYTEREDVRHLQQRIPAQRQKKIAQATLTAEDGLLKDTPTYHEKSHHTWWIPAELEPWLHFRPAEEED